MPTLSELFYMDILNAIMEKWLGPDFNDPIKFTTDKSMPYRMMALLLDDPWNENGYKKSPSYERNYIVDITKPEIQRKLDMLNGPHFNTIMKMLELRMLDEDNERNNNRIENSSGTLV